MPITSAEEMIAYLKKNKEHFHKMFGVTRMGIFGSFARGEQNLSSDIDELFALGGSVVFVG